MQMIFAMNVLLTEEIIHTNYHELTLGVESDGTQR